MTVVHSCCLIEQCRKWVGRSGEGAAAHYADVVGGRDQLGLPIDGLDAQIASICLAHGAALATRNVKDFRHTDVRLIDPWLHP